MGPGFRGRGGRGWRGLQGSPCVRPCRAQRSGQHQESALKAACLQGGVRCAAPRWAGRPLCRRTACTPSVRAIYATTPGLLRTAGSPGGKAGRPGCCHCEARRVSLGPRCTTHVSGLRQQQPGRVEPHPPAARRAPGAQSRCAPCPALNPGCWAQTLQGAGGQAKRACSAAAAAAAVVPQASTGTSRGLPRCRQSIGSFMGCPAGHSTHAAGCVHSGQQVWPGKAAALQTVSPLCQHPDQHPPPNGDLRWSSQQQAGSAALCCSGEQRWQHVPAQLCAPHAPVSPSSPSTRLHTMCRGFCALRASTTSPTTTRPLHTVTCSSSAMSPRGLKVGIMEGPTHCGGAKHGWRECDLGALRRGGRLAWPVLCALMARVASEARRAAACTCRAAAPRCA